MESLTTANLEHEARHIRAVVFDAEQWISTHRAALLTIGVAVSSDDCHVCYECEHEDKEDKRDSDKDEKGDNGDNGDNGDTNGDTNGAADTGDKDGYGSSVGLSNSGGGVSQESIMKLMLTTANIYCDFQELM